jgi:class 3 adenylate cyclase
LNELYRKVVPVVLRHGGHANKFIGDGLLAVFGAPDRLDDHADRAVAAGLEIVELINRSYDGELRVGVGINSGRVVVGTIGGGGRVEFTVIGDPVNTASRVEEATRTTGDDLLITDATKILLKRPHPLIERSSIRLRGKQQPVKVYAPGAEEPAMPVVSRDGGRRARRTPAARAARDASTPPTR